MSIERWPCGCSVVNGTGYPCPAHSHAHAELHDGCPVAVLRARLPVTADGHRHAFRFDVSRDIWVCFCGYTASTFGAALDGSAREK